ncbi:MAG: GDP-mannose 4,6-dehydratase [Phycisphaerae bacterium]|nr:GDP-mannose 4,6-dehydratase [Phycisphaerae bacterium]
MAKPRLLITGSTGFVGSWTIRHWREHHPGVELWATSERPRPAGFQADHYHQLDLCDARAVRLFMDECRPDRVIHLAGLISSDDLTQLLAINVVGTQHLYDALSAATCPSDLRIVQISSAAVFGVIRPEELPISESRNPKPVTPYAVSKVAQDHLAVAMGLSHGLRIVRACVFNILGPGQPESLVPMALIRQLRDVQQGLAHRLRVGDLTPRRDFIDVRDVAAALDVLLERGRPGESYNVASGQDTSIQEIVDAVIALSGVHVPMEVDQGRLRRVEVPCVRADISKIVEEAGWRPRISLRESLEAMWRELLSDSAK